MNNVVNILSILGIAIAMLMIGMSISPNQSQATICPIDQISEHLAEANTAYNEQNYVELKNSLDSMQELVESVEDE